MIIFECYKIKKTNDKFTFICALTCLLAIGQFLSDAADITLFVFSHDQQNTQWKHPVTGKEKYVRGGWFQC